MSNQSVVITRGNPASGKSTWAREQVRIVGSNWKRINKDDIRSMIHDGAWSKQNEHATVAARDAMIRAFLSLGHSVIVDDTNIQNVHIHSIFHIVASEFPGVTVTVMDFDIPVEECLKRDAIRADAVGSAVIYKMYSEYVKLDKDAWKSLVYPTVDYHISDIELPNAIIVDIDGTVSTSNGRGPFQWDKVDTDLPKYHILGVVDAVMDNFKRYVMADTELIFMSGRDEVCYDKTEAWLTSNIDIPFKLHMRKKGDMRKDYIVKRELFEEHVRGKYNVHLVFDDRDQVVHMWRKQLGLTCLQVDYGKF